MFNKSAAFYDAIYHWKNYSEEASMIHQMLQDRVRSGGMHLLDVACGTGAHLIHLAEWSAIP